MTSVLKVRLERQVEILSVFSFDLLHGFSRLPASCFSPSCPLSFLSFVHLLNSDTMVVRVCQRFWWLGENRTLLLIVVFGESESLFSLLYGVQLRHLSHSAKRITPGPGVCAGSFSIKERGKRTWTIQGSNQEEGESTDVCERGNRKNRTGGNREYRTLK